MNVNTATQTVFFHSFKQAKKSFKPVTTSYTSIISVRCFTVLELIDLFRMNKVPDEKSPVPVHKSSANWS